MSESHKAILEGHKVVPVEDLLDWARWYEKADRRVGFTRLKHGKRRRNFVSTVFLGIDHGFARIMGHGGRQLWFETMIFGTSEDQYQERYETWEEAAKGHELAVFRARQARQLRNRSANRRKIRREMRRTIVSLKKAETRRRRAKQTVFTPIKENPGENPPGVS